MADVKTRGHIPAFQGRRCFRESLPAGAFAAGGRETKRQDQDRGNKGTRLAARYFSLLPHRRNTLSVDASSGSMRGF